MCMYSLSMHNITIMHVLMYVHTYVCKYACMNLMQGHLWYTQVWANKVELYLVVNTQTD